MDAQPRKHQMIVDRQEFDHRVTVLRFDDGQMNLFDATSLQALGTAFDGCSGSSAIVLEGRPGVLSAGLNAKDLRELSDAELEELFALLGHVIMRIWLEPRPVVVAATGHAITVGALLAMAADYCVAADGPFRWGMTEAKLGYMSPHYGLALCGYNLGAGDMDDLIMAGTLVGPREAVAAGFAERTVPEEEVRHAAEQRARKLAALPQPAYGENKRRIRGALADEVLAGLERDVRSVVAARPDTRRGGQPLER